MVSHHAVGSTDSMLLSWGSSVNVCEDSRRTIRQEVDRIDSDIANLHGKTKSEDRVSSQVIKDLSHARAEMYNYRRGAADILDNATMNDQVRARLMESLKADLLIPLRKTSMSSDKNHSSSEDIPLDLSINQQSTNAMSFLEKRMYMDILQAATEKMKNVREIKCQKHTLLEKMNKIHSRMLQDNLENNCAESKQIMSNQAIETENEERRMRTIKIAVHEGRNKCGSHAQDIADRTKALTAKKSQHATDEHLLAEELAKAESDQQHASDDLFALKSKCDNMTNHISTLLETIVSFEFLVKARSNKKQQHMEYLVKVANAKIVLDSQRNEHENEIAIAMAVARELEEIKAIRTQVETMRKNNDQIEKEFKEVGSKELAELSKEKEVLATIMTDLDFKAQAPELELQKSLQERGESLAAINDANKRISMDLAEKHTLLENLRKASAESSDTMIESLAELGKIAANLTEARSTEMEAFSELKMELKSYRKKALCDKRLVCLQLGEEVAQKREILSRGFEMLEGVLAAEKILETCNEIVISN